MGIVVADSIAGAAGTGFADADATGLAGAADLEGGLGWLPPGCLTKAVLRGGRGWPGPGRPSPGTC